MKKQDFKVLKTKDLYPFPDNPFHVAEDETLSELAESIKEFGIVTPIITRPKEDGDGYEVIAGQRRVRASELAGINTVPAFVLPLDRDRAIITLVDSNLQRENILPSERAFAYKMKSEAMKRQGFRTDLTSSQVVTKLRTDDKVAQGFGVGRMTVQRFIRCACESEGVASSLSIVAKRFSCSSFFKKDSSTAGVRAIFPSSTICKIGGISSVRRIKRCTVILPTPKPCATLSSVRNFVTTCDEVKSVRKPCRFMASDFIL